MSTTSSKLAILFFGNYSSRIRKEWIGAASSPKTRMKMILPTSTAGRSRTKTNLPPSSWRKSRRRLIFALSPSKFHLGLPTKATLGINKQESAVFGNSSAASTSTLSRQ